MGSHVLDHFKFLIASTAILTQWKIIDTRVHATWLHQPFLITQASSVQYGSQLYHILHITRLLPLAMNF